MRVLMLLSLAAALFVVGCGALGDGTPEGCIGSFIGPYTGSESGNVTSTLRPEGKLVGTFVAADGTFNALLATVADSGSVTSAGSSKVDIDGTFDLMECTATGNWTRTVSTGTVSGTFELRKE